ncbi:hypothetical protein COEX109129_25885 [Corallococcus exiguus]
MGHQCQTPWTRAGALLEQTGEGHAQAFRMAVGHEDRVHQLLLTCEALRELDALLGRGGDAAEEHGGRGRAQRIQLARGGVRGVFHPRDAHAFAREAHQLGERLGARMLRGVGPARAIEPPADGVIAEERIGCLCPGLTVHGRHAGVGVRAGDDAFVALHAEAQVLRADRHAAGFELQGGIRSAARFEDGEDELAASDGVGLGGGGTGAVDAGQGKEADGRGEVVAVLLPEEGMFGGVERGESAHGFGGRVWPRASGHGQDDP